MAFTSTITGTTVMGNKRVINGTYENTGGSTGGDVRTSLSTVERLDLSPTNTSILASESVVNETFPVLNQFGDVTIVTNADEDGQWTAVGL